MAERCGLEAGVVVPKAGGALPLSEDPADDALARRCLNDICYIKQLAWQDSIIDLELSAKPVCDKNRINMDSHQHKLLKGTLLNLKPKGDESTLRFSALSNLGI